MASTNHDVAATQVMTSSASSPMAPYKTLVFEELNKAMANVEDFMQSGALSPHMLATFKRLDVQIKTFTKEAGIELKERLQVDILRNETEILECQLASVRAATSWATAANKRASDYRACFGLSDTPETLDATGFVAPVEVAETLVDSDSEESAQESSQATQDRWTRPRLL